MGTRVVFVWPSRVQRVSQTVPVEVSLENTPLLGYIGRQRLHVVRLLSQGHPASEKQSHRDVSSNHSHAISILTVTNSLIFLCVGCLACKIDVNSTYLHRVVVRRGKKIIKQDFSRRLTQCRCSINMSLFLPL